MNAVNKYVAENKKVLTNQCVIILIGYWDRKIKIIIHAIYQSMM